MRFPNVLTSIVLLCVAAVPVHAIEVVVAADSPPAVLERHTVPENIVAVALSPDGSMLAYAVPSAKTGFSDVVRVAQTPATITLPGEVRDLLFLDSGELVGLQYRPAKKREGDTFLFRVSPGSAKAERVMRVPPSSSDLDRWPAGGAILLACRNEIRTLLLPAYRSGPLFSVPGYNLAVTSLGASSFVLVGRAEELLLIDLSAPSGRESMPVLARSPVPAPVDTLADYPSGSDVLVRLEDGRLFQASFDPIGFRPVGNADGIAGLAKATRGPELPLAVSVARAPVPAPEPTVRRETRPPESVPSVVEDDPVLVAELAEPEAAEPSAAEPAEAPTVIEAEAAEPSAAEPAEAPTVIEAEAASPPERKPVIVAEIVDPPARETPAGDSVPLPALAEEPDAETEPEPVEPGGTDPPAFDADPEPEPTEPAPEVAEPARQAPPDPMHQLGGRIRGRVELVRDVVLFGPDNILNEAARVKLDASGRWGVDGLSAGRYRIMLDGGGDRVLVAEPRFVMVEVGGEPVEATEIKVLRAF